MKNYFIHQFIIYLFISVDNEILLFINVHIYSNLYRNNFRLIIELKSLL